jgi:hypothetical protein
MCNAMWWYAVCHLGAGHSSYVAVPGARPDHSTISAAQCRSSQLPSDSDSSSCTVQLQDRAPCHDRHLRAQNTEAVGELPAQDIILVHVHPPSTGALQPPLCTRLLCSRPACLHVSTHTGCSRHHRHPPRTHTHTSQPHTRGPAAHLNEGLPENKVSRLYLATQLLIWPRTPLILASLSGSSLARSMAARAATRTSACGSEGRAGMVMTAHSRQFRTGRMVKGMAWDVMAQWGAGVAQRISHATLESAKA